MTRLAVAALLFTVYAGMWDVWWHGSVGRDTFWEPPHLLLYAGITASIAIGVYGWYKTREVVWKRLAFALLAILVSAPVDEFWHRAFGTESPASPLIVWSPPHLILVLAVVGSMAMLLPIVGGERDERVRWIMRSALLAGILSLLLFLVLPLQPLGFHALFGFYGATFAAFLTALILLIAQRCPGPLNAVMTSVFVLLLSAMLTGEASATQTVQGIPPHPHPPFWIQITALLGGAAVLDLYVRKSALFRGILFGIVYGLLFYLVTRHFIEPEFAYTFGSAIVAIIASALGGLLAAVVLPFVARLVPSADEATPSLDSAFHTAHTLPEAR